MGIYLNSIITVSARHPLQSMAKLLAGTVDHKYGPSRSQASEDGGICSDDYTAEHGLNSVVEQAIDSAIRANASDPKAHMAAFFLQAHAERSRDA